MRIASVAIVLTISVLIAGPSRGSAQDLIEYALMPAVAQTTDDMRGETLKSLPTGLLSTHSIELIIGGHWDLGPSTGDRDSRCTTGTALNHAGSVREMR